MASFNTLPAQESSAGGGNHREEVQYGIGHDGREENGAGGVEQRDRSVTTGLWTPPSIPRLQHNRDTAIEMFVILNRNFDIRSRRLVFANSDVVMAERKLVDKVFENLCVSNGELAAVT